MDHSMTVYFVTALCLLTIAAGLNMARREFNKKRRDYRMNQALRRGLMESEGLEQIRNRSRVIEWQSCESASGPCS
jgi:hypothetical protein